MILVTGGTGMVGSRLVRGLVDRGKRVRVLSLPGDPYASRLAGVDCRIVSGDIANRESLAHLLDEVKTVYHLAAVILSRDPDVFRRVNSEGTRSLVEASKAAGVNHFIYVSSAAVLSPESSAYAKSKFHAETIVRNQETMESTVVRPTLIYGHGEGAEFRMFERFLETHSIVPFIGRGRAKKNPIHVDDFIQALMEIADNPRTYGKVYNLGGGEEITIRNLARLIVRTKGIRRWFVPVPVPLCRLLALVLERTMKEPPLTRYAISRMVCEANLDHDAAREDLGFRPRGVSEGLAQDRGSSILPI
jgi:nucleoside-diphosphate-sugar epimerase